jgi:hypothetical protein
MFSGPHIYGIMPAGGRFGYLYGCVDPVVRGMEKEERGMRLEDSVGLGPALCATALFGLE